MAQRKYKFGIAITEGNVITRSHPQAADADEINSDRWRKK